VDSKPVPGSSTELQVSFDHTHLNIARDKGGQVSLTDLGKAAGADAY
jgi:hypothetical protein